jgi:hypothetical protein
VITRQTSNEQELNLVPEVDVEPTILSLSNSLPPQAADVVCLLIPSRSRTNSLCASHNERSRANSYSSNDGQNSQPVII